SSSSGSNIANSLSRSCSSCPGPAIERDRWPTLASNVRFGLANLGIPPLHRQEYGFIFYRNTINSKRVCTLVLDAHPHKAPRWHINQESWRHYRILPTQAI